MRPDTVETLVRDNLDLARQEARRWYRLPIEQEDLVSEGALGLVKAARTYDPNRGVPFGAYARIRVRGAILDVIRERARRQGLGDGTFADLRSLDDEDNLFEPTAQGPAVDDVVEALDKLRLVADLPERERIALIRNTVLGDTLAEIGADLGVSEARVSILAARGAARLRKAA